MAIEIHPEITAHKISHDFIKLLVSLEITPNPVNKVTKSSLILSNEFLQRTSLTLIILMGNTRFFKFNYHDV